MSHVVSHDGDETFNVSAKLYQILDKKTRKVLRTAPFKGFKFSKKKGHYVAIKEPKYDKKTEELALCYM